jgi:prepilin-type N-terminal cleavage/methylation domain-containing protein
MLRSRLRAADGFTLVEVLVVVLIIGILAAIGVAEYLPQRGKAYDADAKASVSTAAKALEAWSTSHGTYAGATPADLRDIEPSLHSADGLAIESATDTVFKVSVDSRGPGGAFSIARRADGTLVRDCTQPGRGSCLDPADALGNRW